MAPALVPSQQSRSFPVQFEQTAINWILPRIPSNITLLNLAVVGMAGSFVASAALVCCKSGMLQIAKQERPPSFDVAQMRVRIFSPSLQARS